MWSLGTYLDQKTIILSLKFKSNTMSLFSFAKCEDHPQSPFCSGVALVPPWWNLLAPSLAAEPPPPPQICFFCLWKNQEALVALFLLQRTENAFPFDTAHSVYIFGGGFLVAGITCGEQRRLWVMLADCRGPAVSLIWGLLKDAGNSHGRRGAAISPCQDLSSSVNSFWGYRWILKGLTRKARKRQKCFRVYWAALRLWPLGPVVFHFSNCCGLCKKLFPKGPFHLHKKRFRKAFSLFFSSSFFVFLKQRQKCKRQSIWTKYWGRNTYRVKKDEPDTYAKGKHEKLIKLTPEKVFMLDFLEDILTFEFPPWLAI